MKVDRYLLELISDIQDYGCDITDGKRKVSNKTLAGHLALHGVGVIPAVPGRPQDDTNVAEMSYRNGQQAERERIVKLLKALADKLNGAQAATLNAAVEAIWV